MSIYYKMEKLIKYYDFMWYVSSFKTKFTNGEVFVVFK